MHANTWWKHEFRHKHMNYWWYCHPSNQIIGYISTNLSWIKYNWKEDKIRLTEKKTRRRLRWLIDCLMCGVIFSNVEELLCLFAGNIFAFHVLDRILVCNDLFGTKHDFSSAHIWLDGKATVSFLEPGFPSPFIVRDIEAGVYFGMSILYARIICIFH